MTTVTQTDAASELAGAHQELDEARRTRARRGEAYRAFQAGQERAKAELGQLAQSDPA